MTDTIERAECPECGRGWAAHAEKWRRLCSGVPVERTYVAVDALLDRPAQAAAVDWMQRDGDPHETERVVSRVIATAINAVTGEAKCHWSDCPHGSECVHAVTGEA